MAKPNSGSPTSKWPTPKPISPAVSAERMLNVLHSTCSHDLPNQIVSLQSLISLLEMDEVDRLDAAGREYLRRLRGVADKIDGLTGFLKSMVRLVRHVPHIKPTSLRDFFRELQAEAKSVLETPLTWDLRLADVSVRLDHDLAYSSVGDLLRATAEGIHPRIAKTVTVTSTSSPGIVRVDMSVVGPGVETLASQLDARCDVILARERLRLSEISFAFGPLDNEGVRVIFEFRSSDYE